MWTSSLNLQIQLNIYRCSTLMTHIRITTINCLVPSGKMSLREATRQWSIVHTRKTGFPVGNSSHGFDIRPSFLAFMEICKAIDFALQLCTKDVDYVHLANLVVPPFSCDYKETGCIHVLMYKLFYFNVCYNLRGSDSSDFTSSETLKFKNPPFQHILMYHSYLA